MNVFKSRRSKMLAVFGSLGVMLVFNYSNCAPVSFKPAASNSTSSVAGASNVGLVTVTGVQNPVPLDLFFIVDNSQSMPNHSIDLGKSFSTLFTNNSGKLSQYDTRIFLFSTASTFNSSFETKIPTQSPLSVATLADPTNPTAVGAMPGGIFSYWNASGNVFSTPPYAVQLLPAPVLSKTNGMVSTSMFIAKQGTQSSATYASQVAAVSSQFQSAIAYLSAAPSQTAFEPATDVSSGLCTMGRILTHPAGLIASGESAAFILVSDDDDRLNDRNAPAADTFNPSPTKNSCFDSISAGQEMQSVSCGNYVTNFNYNSYTSLKYYSDAKINYPSSSKIAYTYPVSETCQVTSPKGTNYSYTYTKLQTKLTYQSCVLGDGTCALDSPQTSTVIAGNFVGSNGTCLSGFTAPSNAFPGTSYTCSDASLTGQTGSGVDSTTQTQGSACSTTIQKNIAASNSIITSCTYGTADVVTSNPVVALNLANVMAPCTAYCSTNGCKAISASVIQSATQYYPIDYPGLDCTSTCPAGVSGCDAGKTVASVIDEHQANSVCTSTSPATISSQLVVGSAIDSTGAPISCSSSLTGLSIKLNGAAVCASSATVKTIADCVKSLVPEDTCSSSYFAAGDVAYLSSQNVATLSCNTACSASGGLCTNAETLGAYVASKGGSCIGSNGDSGAKTLPLSFVPSVAQTASCSTACSQTTQGSCNGYTSGTVAQYIASIGGGDCSGAASFTAVNTISVPTSQDVATACANVAGTTFSKASGSPSSAVTSNFIASSDSIADMQNYLISKSKSFFGAENLPTVSVIGHSASDNLPGTAVSTTYNAVAQAIDSKAVFSSITQDFGTSLTSISARITESALNSFPLPLATGESVTSVAVSLKGGAWIPLTNSQWSMSGNTLSVSGAVGLSVNDQVQYTFSQK